MKVPTSDTMDVRLFRSGKRNDRPRLHCALITVCTAIGEYRCDHPWPKPKPGMILQAVSDLRLDPARCVIAIR